MSRAAIEQRDELRRAVSSRDAEVQRLRGQLSHAGQDREALASQLQAMRADIRRARLFAGDNLPAASGLTLITMLEKALRGGAE